jgi:FAD/FMN-containing dehydrogenase
MKKQYPRKEFLKLTILANLGLYINPLKFIDKKTRDNFFFSPTADNVLYFKKGDAAYETLRKGFNKRINKFPQIIAQCLNTKGVSEAIIYAVKNKLPVAIKSGGHCMEGFSVNNGGMVINLSSLNSVELNNDVVTVGPGCTLSKLYDAILPKGRYFPGGSCGGVGIGGLTLGGGYGLLSRKFGLTCDSLQEITMVDGKGKIISSIDDKDLLWACKGGGNGNFGVITQLKFKTYTAPNSLQSFRFRYYKLNTVSAKGFLKKWFEASAYLPVSCFSAFVLNGKTGYILLTNCDKNTEKVQKFVSIFSKDADKFTQTQPQSLAQSLKVFYGQKDPLYFKNASAGLYKNFGEIDNYIDKVLDIVISTPGMIYQVNTLGGNINNADFEKASAFAHRSSIYFSELQTYWPDPKQESRFIQRFETVQSIFSDNGILTQYRNYPDLNFKNWNALYYGSNYAKLQQIKNKYDPGNVIRHEQSIKNSVI